MKRKKVQVNTSKIRDKASTGEVIIGDIIKDIIEGIIIITNKDTSNGIKMTHKISKSIQISIGSKYTTEEITIPISIITISEEEISQEIAIFICDLLSHLLHIFIGKICKKIFLTILMTFHHNQHIFPFPLIFLSRIFLQMDILPTAILIIIIIKIKHIKHKTAKPLDKINQNLCKVKVFLCKEIIITRKKDSNKEVRNSKNAGEGEEGRDVPDLVQNQEKQVLFHLTKAKKSS